MNTLLGYICQRCPNILWLQLWILLEDLRLWNTLRDHTHHEIDRDACVSDHRLTRHNAGIQGDALLKVVVHCYLLIECHSATYLPDEFRQDIHDLVE